MYDKRSLNHFISISLKWQLIHEIHNLFYCAICHYFFPLLKGLFIVQSNILIAIDCTNTSSWTKIRMSLHDIKSICQQALVSKISIERLLFVISFLFILQKNSPLHTWQTSLPMQMNFSTPSFIFALIHSFFHLSICFFHPLLYRMRLIYTHLKCLCLYTKSYVAIMLRNILKSPSRFLTC